MMITKADARLAKSDLKEHLRDIPGFQGIGLTWDDDSNYVVLVKVDKAYKQEILSIINALEIGVPIEIEEIGIVTFE